MFGGGKKGQEAMDKFFGGESSSINVSELSGKLGKMLNGMEEGLSKGNITLANNPSEKPEDAINNCHNCTINLTSDGKVDSKPLAKINSPQSYVANPYLFDNTLITNYRNVATPRLGDAIRYSNDGGNTTTHGSVFLLSKQNDIQIFTKNGYSNSSPYSIMMQSQIVQTYGQPTGIQNREVTTQTSTSMQTKTVNDKTGFYK